MRKVIFGCFLMLCLLQSAVSALTCPSGTYDIGSGTKCVQCSPIYSTCTAFNQGILKSEFTAYKTATSGGNTYSDPYCGAGVYNTKTGNCENFCATGCYSCQIENTWCTSCNNGYVWNSNYTCIPAIIGLEAASLALLFITLIFTIIGCCYVNKARK